MVNNNAAAVLLMLTVLAFERQVCVSRGELVEIGGKFRIPEVMEQSGGILVEVGTTNRTYLEDYTGAVTENTAAFLKVHTSNYQITGFTCAPSVKELAEEAHKRQLYLLVDLGQRRSGLHSRNGTEKRQSGQFWLRGQTWCPLVGTSCWVGRRQGYLQEKEN